MNLEFNHEIIKGYKSSVEKPSIAAKYKEKINGFHDKKELSLFLISEPKEEWVSELKL